MTRWPELGCQWGRRKEDKAKENCGCTYNRFSNCQGKRRNQIWCPHIHLPVRSLIQGTRNVQGWGGLMDHPGVCWDPQNDSLHTGFYWKDTLRCPIRMVQAWQLVVKVCGAPWQKVACLKYKTKTVSLMECRRQPNLRYVWAAGRNHWLC